MFNGFFNWLSGLGGSSDGEDLDIGTGGGGINPANGLPMVTDGGFDVAGNAFGTGSPFDDSSTSMFDDSSTSMDMGLSDDTFSNSSITDDSSSFGMDDSFGFDSCSGFDD